MTFTEVDATEAFLTGWLAGCGSPLALRSRELAVAIIDIRPGHRRSTP